MSSPLTSPVKSPDSSPQQQHLKSSSVLSTGGTEKMDSLFDPDNDNVSPELRSLLNSSSSFSSDSIKTPKQPGTLDKKVSLASTFSAEDLGLKKDEADHLKNVTATHTATLPPPPPTNLPPLPDSTLLPPLDSNLPPPPDSEAKGGTQPGPGAVDETTEQPTGPLNSPKPTSTPVTTTKTPEPKAQEKGTLWEVAAYVGLVAGLVILAFGALCLADIFPAKWLGVIGSSVTMGVGGLFFVSSVAYFICHSSREKTS